MKKNTLLPILLAFTTPIIGQTHQNSVGRSQGTSPQIDKLYEIYYDAVTIPNEMICGKEYLPYFFHGVTTPLFLSGETFNAALKIRGREYRNVRLQYDTYLDELIYTDTTRLVANTVPCIALNKEIIDGFRFVFRGDSMTFRYLKFHDPDMADGFYEVAYNGNTRFIIRHKSKLYIYDALTEYAYSPERYIMIGSKYYRIKNNKTFLSLFGEHSGEIKKFLKKSRTRIKVADKNAIIKALEYFDSLCISKAIIQ